MNHVTSEERRALKEAAHALVQIYDNGEIIGGLSGTADNLAAQTGVSLYRARLAVSQAARLKRGEIVKTRPGREPMGDGMTAITVYMSAAQIEYARTLGAGNVSAGVRTALEAYQAQAPEGMGWQTLASARAAWGNDYDLVPHSCDGCGKQFEEDEIYFISSIGEFHGKCGKE